MSTQPTTPQYQQTTSSDSGSGQSVSGPGPQGGQGGTQGQANALQRLLARWYQVAKQMAADDPRLASGANKVAEGIQEMQTALVTPQQQTPATQQPSYS